MSGENLRGRRVRLISLAPEMVVELFKGGVFQVGPPPLPEDATPAGAWEDARSGEILIAVHSQRFHLVRFGNPLPRVEPIEIRSLLKGPETVSRNDDPLQCCRCGQGFSDGVTIGAPLVYRFCEACAA